MIDWDQVTKNHIDVLLTKMFEIVGLDWSNTEIKADYDVFNRESEWYLRNEWTVEQEREFVEWMTEYLMNNSGARRCLMSAPFKSKKRCWLAASQYASFYGWKTKKDEKEQ
jgi:hypothetical protein